MSRLVRWRRLVPRLCCGVLILLASGAALGQTEQIYVRIDTVLGDATEKNHRDWIEAYALDHAETAPTTGSGPGGSAPAKLTTVAFLKVIDRASVDLQRLLTTGDQVPTAEIDVCRVQSDRIDCYYNIALERVTVVNRALAGTACLDARTCPDRSVESIALDYVITRWTYRIFDEVGNVIGTETGGWDKEKNQPPPN